VKGKIMVMTIITGVKSPWILGADQEPQRAPARSMVDEELGIEVLR